MFWRERGFIQRAVYTKYFRYIKWKDIMQIYRSYQLLLKETRIFQVFMLYEFLHQLSRRTSLLELSDFGKNVILIMPHPDDMEIHCGGTVAKLAQAHVSMHLVICSSGVPERLRKSDIMAAQQLEFRRQEEQRRAADLLGVERVTFLSHTDDFELQADESLVSKIAAIYLDVQPCSVILFDHRYPSVSSKRDEVRPLGIHPDHLAAGKAAHKALLVEGVQTPRAFYVASWRTNRHFAISEEQLNKKIDAMKLHVSQQLEKKGSVKQARILARCAGMLRWSYAVEMFAEYGHFQSEQKRFGGGILRCS